MDMSDTSSDSTSNSTMAASSMLMTFFTSKSTPLYSADWMPSSTGGYAGTCIFLIILAIISRGFGAWRQALERRWHDRAAYPRYIVVAGKESENERYTDKAKEESESAVLSYRGIDENVRVVKTRQRSPEGVPWRLSVDMPRAVVATIQAGVGYLLMLAVMSLNVGYFLSVLGGLFAGELVFGRYTAAGGH